MGNCFGCCGSPQKEKTKVDLLGTPLPATPRTKKSSGSTPPSSAAAAVVSAVKSSYGSLLGRDPPPAATTEERRPLIPPSSTGSASQQPRAPPDNRGAPVTATIASSAGRTSSTAAAAKAPSAPPPSDPAATPSPSTAPAPKPVPSGKVDDTFKPAPGPSSAAAAGSSEPGGGSSSPQPQLTDKYIIQEVLGVGSTSTCHRCTNKATGVDYACKVIDKRHIESRFRGLLTQFHVEIDALKLLNHSNIIRLVDVYITPSKIYMIMELMSGGELFDYVVEKGTLTEEEASVIVRKVVSAVVYMHEKGIIHRDMKPENLLLTHRPKAGATGDAAIPEVKIIDFGLSKLVGTDAPTSSEKQDDVPPLDVGMARSFLGTRGYLAPEMLQRQTYSKAVDIWAVGVIVFVLLCGCLPFDDDADVPSDQDVRAKFILRFPKWARNLSESAKDLLRHLLDCDPKTRYTAAQAAAHPWVSGRDVKPQNYLQSPSRIRTPGRNGTPGQPNRGGSAAQQAKDRVADLVSGRAKEEKVVDKVAGKAEKDGGGEGGGMIRKNSI